MADRLRKNPDDYPFFLQLLTQRKLRHLANRWGGFEPEPGSSDERYRMTEKRAAYDLARQEMKRGLARVNLRLSELKVNSFARNLHGARTLRLRPKHNLTFHPVEGSCAVKILQSMISLHILGVPLSHSQRRMTK